MNTQYKKDLERLKNKIEKAVSKFERKHCVTVSSIIMSMDKDHGYIGVVGEGGQTKFSGPSLSRIVDIDANAAQLYWVNTADGFAVMDNGQRFTSDDGGTWTPLRFT